MSLQELQALPIGDWAANQSLVWLWATNSKDRYTKKPILSCAFDLMNTWGFTYYTVITWNKLTGPCPFGPYQITTEQILFGYKGKACFSKNSMGKLKTFFTEVSAAHSVKPASFYAQICKWFEGPRLDVFARQSHAGFDGWGDQYNLYH